MHHSKKEPALDWASKVESENIALIPDFDNARNSLGYLIIQVGDYWVERQDGTTLDAKELRSNQFKNTVPLKIQCDLLVANDRHVRNTNAATFISGLKAALADESVFQDYMTKTVPGFGAGEMNTIHVYLEANDMTFDEAAAKIAAGMAPAKPKLPPLLPPAHTGSPIGAPLENAPGWFHSFDNDGYADGATYVAPDGTRYFKEVGTLRGTLWTQIA